MNIEIHRGDLKYLTMLLDESIEADKSKLEQSGGKDLTHYIQQHETLLVELRKVFQDREQAIIIVTAPQGE